jgi:signal transduction histidine kinase
MDAKTQARAFDPFFTTRAGGTGLGLAIVQSIAEKHYGLVTLKSTIGIGTEFRVYLPEDFE